ncbi:MAG: hypothetical protein IPJ77_02100 [Planctomycetes bacterium]|nr:hypothetical protein [Planctomycetota bacterium]
MNALAIACALAFAAQDAPDAAPSRGAPPAPAASAANAASQAGERPTRPLGASAPGATAPQAAPAASPSGSRATLVPDPASAEIGQPIEWLLDVVHPAALKVVFPAKDAEDRRWAPVGERTVARAPDPADPKLVHTIARWSAMALEPGELAPPPLVLELTGGAATETLTVAGLPVHVVGALVEGEDAPRPLLGFRALPDGLEPARGVPLALLAGLGALVLGGVAFLVVRRRKPAPAPAPTPLAELDALARAFAADPESGRARVFELSRLVRGAVDAFLAVDRSGRTDDDWVRATEADERVPLGVRTTCARLLAAVERVKYAQETPTRVAVEAFVADARTALEALAGAPRDFVGAAGSTSARAGERAA